MSVISNSSTAAGFIAPLSAIIAKPSADEVAKESTATCDTLDTCIGSTVGHFLIESVIASGGMGTVFKAVQLEPVRRPVALKMIKLGLGDARTNARFHAERQALALMDHADIAKVYEADSTPAGQPYFAMEFCEGLPIDRYCDAQQLNVRQRIELIIRLARAVNRAHSQGVIHRDLKPGNILVANDSGRAVLKVIDFGIAKFTDNQFDAVDHHATRVGEMVGTPAYMSPEQATGGEIDARTDVFAIGAVLFKLLTGSTPLGPPPPQTQSLAQLIAHIQSYQATTPSQRFVSLDASAQQQVLHSFRLQRRNQWLASVKGDLDWIVLRAIEAERTRRYANASDLADDLERYLNNKPTLAAAPTLRYRAKKFYLRNRSSVIATAVVLFVMTLAGLFGAASWWRLKSEEYAELERVRCEAELLLDEANSARARAVTGGPDSAVEFAAASNTLDDVKSILASHPRLFELNQRTIRLANKIREEQWAVSFGNKLDIARERSIQIDSAKDDDAFEVATGSELLRDALREFGVDPATASPSEAANILRSCPPSVLDKVIESLDFLLHDAPLGAGIYVREQGGVFTVANFVPSTQLDAGADITSGDRLLMVNQVNMLESLSVAEMRSVAYQQLFSKPGDKVTVTLVRGTAAPFQCELTCGGAMAHWANQVLAQLDPDPWRMHLRGAVLTGDLAALQQLVDSEHIPRQRPASLIQLAGAMLKLEPSNAAIRFLENAQQHHPQSYWLNHYLGTALAVAHEPPMPEQALRYLTAAVSLRPHSVGARVNLAESLTRTGKTHQALVQTRIAFEFAPQPSATTDPLTTDSPHFASKPLIKIAPADAWEQRARELARNGDRDEALRIVNQAVADSSGSANALRTKGVVFIELEDYVAAKIILADAVEVTPDDAATRFYYGVALQCLGDMQGALHEYEAALAIEPDNETVREFLYGIKQVSTF